MMNNNWGNPAQRWDDSNHLWQDPANTVDKSDEDNNQSSVPDESPAEPTGAPAAANPEPQRQPQAHLPKAEPTNNSDAPVWPSSGTEAQLSSSPVGGMAATENDIEASASQSDDDAATAKEPEPDDDLAAPGEPESGGQAPVPPNIGEGIATEGENRDPYPMSRTENEESADGVPEPDASGPEAQEAGDRTEILPVAGLVQAPGAPEQDSALEETTVLEDVSIDTLESRETQPDIEPHKSDESLRVPQAASQAALKPQVDGADPAAEHSRPSPAPDSPDTHSTGADPQPTMSDGFRGPLLPQRPDDPKPPSMSETPVRPTEHEPPPVWDYDEPPSAVAANQPKQTPSSVAGDQENWTPPADQTSANPAEQQPPKPADGRTQSAYADEPLQQATAGRWHPEATDSRNYPQTTADQQAPHPESPDPVHPGVQQPPPGSYPPPTDTQRTPSASSAQETQRPIDGHQGRTSPGVPQHPGDHPSTTGVRRPTGSQPAPPVPPANGPTPPSNAPRPAASSTGYQQPGGYPSPQATSERRAPASHQTHSTSSDPKPQNPQDSYQAPPAPGIYPPAASTQQTAAGSPTQRQTPTGNGYHRPASPHAPQQSGGYPPAQQVSGSPAHNYPAFPQSRGSYQVAPTSGGPQVSAGQQMPRTPSGQGVPAAPYGTGTAQAPSGYPQTAVHQSATSDWPGYAQSYSQAANVSPDHEILLASFGRRVVGWLFDYLLPGLALGIVSAIPPIVTDNSPSASTISTVLLWGLPIVWFLVLSLLSGKTGATPGRKVAKTKLVDARTGQPIGVGKTFLRYICHFIDNVLCFVGWLFPLWDKRRQTLADKILATYVIETG